MGGNLALTVREEDGTEHRMDRWTNAMPWFITNMDLVNKNPAHLQGYLETWYGFVEDWNKNGARFDQMQAAGDDGAYDIFEHNMTPVYAGHQYLAPSEYGQVVVDYQNNVVLHSQGYTDFGRMSYVCAKQMLYQEGVERFWERHPEHGAGDHCRLREFFEDGRIIRISAYRDPPELTKIEDIPDSNTLLAFLQWERSRNDEEMRPDEYSNFEFDMSPWTVTRFEESAEGIRELKQAILDLGFVLTEREDELWDEFLQRWSEDDE